MIQWGQKSKPPKIPRASNKTQKIPWTKLKPQKDPMLNFWAISNLFTELDGWDTWELSCIFRFFWIPPKCPLKSSYPKKYLPKFSNPKKSRNRKFQTKKNPLIIPITWNPEYPPGLVTTLGSKAKHLQLTSLWSVLSHLFPAIAIRISDGPYLCNSLIQFFNAWNEL